MFRTLAILALLVVPAWAGDMRPSDLSNLRTTALDAINADRADRELGALERSATLDEIAQSHALDMLRRDYFAHRAPDGDAVRDRFVAAGGSKALLVGENLAKCTGCPAPDDARVRELQEGWMNSAGHRRNILTAGFDRFGFGIVHEGGRQYAVQTFAGAGSDEGDTVAADAVPTVLAELVNEARKGAPLGVSADLSARLRERAGLDAMPDLGALTREAGADFGRVALLSASCGGCGAALTRNDLAGFVERWIENRADTLGGPFTHMAAAAFADGSGRNRAFLLLAAKR